MEAYYHNDPRIEEWVEQIVETIFATCLLTGANADVEFQKGCQIVGTITSLFQGFSNFPTEYLEDALKQILDQQLPDKRIINNFPMFQETMNKMLHAGMLSISKDKDLEPASVATDELLETSDNEVEPTEDVVVAAFAPALTSINHQKVLFEETKCELVQANQVPNNAERLNVVLQNIFPNAPINWNVSLLGQEFLAQVENEDVLICLYDLERSSQTEKFKNDSLKIVMIREEDLNYPRRLEREIKNTLRTGKKPKQR